MATITDPGRGRYWQGPERRTVAKTNDAEVDFERIGVNIFRYSLALIFVSIGCLKFTAYEAKNIEPLVMNSPLWAWALQSFGLQTLSNMIGVIEIAIGVLTATRPL